MKSHQHVARSMFRMLDWSLLKRQTRIFSLQLGNTRRLTRRIYMPETCRITEIGDNSGAQPFLHLRTDLPA